jgi:hypothetical protein
MSNFHLFFSDQVAGGGPSWTDPEIRVGVQDIGCPYWPVFLCWKCPVCRGIIVQEQNHLVELPTSFSLKNVLQLNQQRWVIFRVDTLALWKIVNEENAVLISKNPGEIFSADFVLGHFWGWVTRYGATTLTVAFSSCHSDITSFRP